jgi:hypothetical protein
VHQVSTNVTILFQTTDDGQAVFAGNYPENGQISDSIKAGKKFLNMSRLPKENRIKDNLPVDAMGSIEDGVFVENGATA